MADVLKVLPHGLRDRNRLHPDAEPLAEKRGVRLRARGGSEARHRVCVNPRNGELQLRERSVSDDEAERGVEPAGNPDHDIPDADASEPERERVDLSCVDLRRIARERRGGLSPLRHLREAAERSAGLQIFFEPLVHNDGYYTKIRSQAAARFDATFSSCRSPARRRPSRRNSDRRAGSHSLRPSPCPCGFRGPVRSRRG